MKPFLDIDGVEVCDEEETLSILLHEGVLFCNSRKYVCIDGKVKDETIVLFVNCNDVFAWGTADAESLSYDEIPKLYRAWEADKHHGVAKFCALRRQVRPQKPVIDAMKKDGVWDALMETLPE